MNTQGPIDLLRNTSLQAGSGYDSLFDENLFDEVLFDEGGVDDQAPIPTRLLK